MQKQVAQRLNVDEATVHNWEKNHTKPGVRFIPRIIKFLGYTPFTAGGSLPERLRARRLALGLSFRKLAKMLGVD
jgi:transcriptional regulator with XRE-family HTH domain